MLEHFFLRIVHGELLGIDPHALTHEERRIVDMLARLDLEAFVKLADNERELSVEQIEEQIAIALRADSKARKIDGSEAQVATARGDLTAGVIDVAHNARTATHVRDLRFGRALVVLEVEGRIHEAEVREQTLGRAAHSELEEIVVRIARIVVHAFLHAEDLHREDGRFATAKAFFSCQQDVLDDHAAFSRRIHAVVDRRRTGSERQRGNAWCSGYERVPPIAWNVVRSVSAFAELSA